MKNEITSLIATISINIALSIVVGGIVGTLADKYELPMYVLAPIPFIAGFTIPFITQRIVKSL